LLQGNPRGRETCEYEGRDRRTGETRKKMVQRRNSKIIYTVSCSSSEGNSRGRRSPARREIGRGVDARQSSIQIVAGLILVGQFFQKETEAKAEEAKRRYTIKLISRRSGMGVRERGAAGKAAFGPQIEPGYRTGTTAKTWEKLKGDHTT